MHRFRQCLLQLFSAFIYVIIKEDRRNMHAEQAPEVAIIVNLWYQICSKVIQSIKLSSETKSAI